jgi:hypothetical protein
MDAMDPRTERVLAARRRRKRQRAVPPAAEVVPAVTEAS